MPTTWKLFAALPFFLFPAAAVAQAGHGGHESPYTEMGDREIKSLSPEDVEALREGQGMGFALAAELNGFPGPKHVLEMEGSLGLTPEQLARVETIHREMNEEARRLGTRLIGAEHELDRAFAEASVDASLLRTLVHEAGELRSQVRLAHLSAHLETMEVLEPRQVHQYRRLRGYDPGHEHGSGAHRR